MRAPDHMPEAEQDGLGGKGFREGASDARAKYAAGGSGVQDRQQEAAVAGGRAMQPETGRDADGLSSGRRGGAGCNCGACPLV